MARDGRQGLAAWAEPLARTLPPPQNPARFEGDDRVELALSASVPFLESLASTLTGTTMFWLDAHFSPDCPQGRLAPAPSTREAAMADRRWIVFECPHDGSVVVSRLEGDRATGVCECPDVRTAEAVLEAMRMRDGKREARPSSQHSSQPTAGA